MSRYNFQNANTIQYSSEKYEPFNPTALVALVVENVYSESVQRVGHSPLCGATLPYHQRRLGNRYALSTEYCFGNQILEIQILDFVCEL